MPSRRRPGEVRDAIRNYLRKIKREAKVAEIHEAVVATIGEVPKSSVRSSLRLSELFEQTSRGRYRLSGK